MMARGTIHARAVSTMTMMSRRAHSRTATAALSYGVAVLFMPQLGGTLRYRRRDRVCVPEPRYDTSWRKAVPRDWVAGIRGMDPQCSDQPARS